MLPPGTGSGGSVELIINLTKALLGGVVSRALSAPFRLRGKNDHPNRPCVYPILPKLLTGARLPEP